VKGLRRSTESRYSGLVKDLSGLLESARRASARAVNTVMTVTYWEIGRRIVEFEQGGEKRAQYGAELLERLSADLTRRFGRGFSRPNLQRFRDFYRSFPLEEIRSTPSSISPPGETARIRSTLSSESSGGVPPSAPEKAAIHGLAGDFPLLDPLLGEERRSRPIRARGTSQQGACPRVPARVAR
jgi:uncharacterized protein DUF1016